MVRLNLLRVMTALGVLMSLYLVVQHVNFELTGKVKGPVCEIALTVSEKLDCEKTEASAFSNVFGVPTAVFGFLYFLAFFLLVVLARPSAPAEGREYSPLDDPFWAVVALFAAIGLLVSLVFAAISAFVIGGFCAGCAIVYLITLANAGLATHVSLVETIALVISGVPAMWRGFVRLYGDDRPPNTSRARSAIALFFVLVIPVSCGLPVLYVVRSREAAVLKDYREQKEVKFDVGPGALAKGSADAPLQIVVFSDFRCPGCAKLQPELKKLLDNFRPEDYRLVYKHYPLDKECNEAFRKLKLSGNHDGACELAAMGQALAQFGKFWDFYADLYAIKSKEIYGPLKALAGRAGLDYLDWVRAAKSGDTMRQVHEDINEGGPPVFTELPAIFVNGRLLSSGHPRSIEIILRHVLGTKDLKQAPPNAKTPPSPSVTPGSPAASGSP